MVKTILAYLPLLALFACTTDSVSTPAEQTPVPLVTAQNQVATGAPKTYERWAHLHTSAQIEAIKEIEAQCPSADFTFMWGDGWTREDGIVRGRIVVKGSTFALAGENGLAKVQETKRCANAFWDAKA
ncbi:MAG: hypothetical protein AAF700_11285 [Pseudomonadota bacterium]